MSADQHIDRTVAALAEAMVHNNEEAAARHAIELLAMALKDVHRIADAVEHIAGLLA